MLVAAVAVVDETAHATRRHGTTDVVARKQLIEFHVEGCDEGLQQHLDPIKRRDQFRLRAATP